MRGVLDHPLSRHDNAEEEFGDQGRPRPRLLVFSVKMHADLVASHHTLTASSASSTSSASYHGRIGHHRGRLCLATTLVAFLLGLLVGVTIPVVFLPRTLPYSTSPATRTASTTSTTLPTLPDNNHSVVWTLPHTNATPPASNYNYTTLLRVPEAVTLLDPADFPTVSFVAKVSPPMPHLLRQKLYGDPPSTSPPSSTPTLHTSGVYWTSDVEATLPSGYDADASDAWRRFARRTAVVKVEAGCGRMQNRLLTYEDGTRSCCRYRQNMDQIQGELFSFYLGRLLRLRNLAPSALALVRLDAAPFSRVAAQLSLAQWTDDRAVVLTKFIGHLQPAYIPSALRTASRRLHPPDIPSTSTKEDLVDLAQWSDLILFDYLTANLDRLVNNLYNLQWNADMMDAPAHNLARDPENGLLVFLDNESGLLHGYRLLDKYEHFHLALLEAVCVFRRETADVIKELRRTRDIGDRLHRLFTQYDPKFRDVLPTLPEKSVKILNDRIDRVFDQITMCERQYPEQGGAGS